jgi:hypothetical protein
MALDLGIPISRKGIFAGTPAAAAAMAVKKPLQLIFSNSLPISVTARTSSYSFHSANRIGWQCAAMDIRPGV